MNNRRDFIKKCATAAIAGPILTSTACAGSGSSPTATKPIAFARKNWFWTNPNLKDEEKDLVDFYKKCRDAGIHGILFESDSEKHFRIAKEQGLEAHRWIWTTNRSEKLESNPEWYAVNRKGESCVDKPPYVGYYRWLCPSREDVCNYIVSEVQAQLDKDYVDGVHLDYVRFCDIILPVNLWKKYNIVQVQELPEYDYCYCEMCKKKFNEWSGVDLASFEYPEASISWRQFRYDAITSLVNRIAAETNAKKKPLTAAVFPTPEVARRDVRQDWTNWHLDGVFPMIYHGFYNEQVKWIGDAVAEGIRGIDGRFPLYAGVFLSDFANAQELDAGMRYALDNGASGISFFGEVTDEILKVLKKL
jgi:hypothetical protein